MSIPYFSAAIFGSAYGSLGTVGYQLFNADGTASGSRLTAGITERPPASGTYAATVTLPSGFTGEVRWDTGGVPARYASDVIPVAPPSPPPPPSPLPPPALSRGRAPTAVITPLSVWQGSDPVLMARVLIPRDGNLDGVHQADVSGIVCTVFDAASAVGSPLSLDVTSVVFDTYQTGTLWSRDETGYNFLHQLPHAYLPAGGRLYRIEYVWTLTGGTRFAVVYQLQSTGLQSLS